jgi:chorismate mutase-like protein
MDKPAPTLDELRRRLDAIDDSIHDLVMERAGMVVRIAALKQSTGQPSFRPGREAEILRRLASRHRGPFPLQSLVRLWRELLGGTVAIQGGFRVAVPDGQPGLWDLLRDHFGGYLPLLPCVDAAAVLAAVAKGSAHAGVLAMPVADDPVPWWPLLVARRGDGARIVARLPFADAGNGRGRDAFVVGAAAADPTGDDRTLLAIAAAKTMTPARLVAALEGIDTPVTLIATHAHAATETWHLVEFDGTVTADDPRLTAALRSVGEPAPTAWALGGYARPLPREEK